jgi:hypothetical protein
MATKKFSFGSPDVTTSKKRGGGPSMGASSLPIGQGLDLRIPSLQPQASGASTFVAPTAPRAAGPTAVPQGSTVAKPSPDLDNLATSLKSLNTNLQNFTTSYLSYEQQENKLAKERAEEVAVKLSKTNGNLMGDYNKLLEKADRDRNSKVLSAQQITLAEDNYNLLKSLDPRAGDYLARSLEYQKGLQLIANAPDYINNLRDEDDKPIILKPYTEDGTPSPLDIALTKYYSDAGVGTPSVLIDLRQSMVNQNANIKRTVSKQYADQQDGFHKDAFIYDINNKIKSNFLTERKNYVKGTDLTEAFDTLFISGMSFKGREDIETNFKTTLTNLVIANSINKEGNIDPALFDSVKDYIIDELKAAETGPLTNEKRSLLISDKGKLGPFFIAELETELGNKYYQAKNSRELTNKLAAVNSEQNLFYSKLESFKDADEKTEGIQPWVINVGGLKNPRNVKFSLNPKRLTEYATTRKQEILNAPGDYKTRKDKIEVLEDLVSLHLKGLEGDQYTAGQELEDYIGLFNVSPQLKLAKVRHAERYNLISKDQANDLTSRVDGLIRLQEAEVKYVIDTAYNDLVQNELNQAALNDLLGVAGIESRNQVTGDEQVRIAALLDETVLESSRIWADKEDKLNKRQKLAEIRKLWGVTKDKFNKMNVEAKDKLNANNPYIKEYERILGKQSDVQRTEGGKPNLKDGEVEQVTITRLDNSVYTVPDTSYSDNEEYELAVSDVEEAVYNWETLSEYYKKLVGDGTIKDGDQILMPDLDLLRKDPQAWQRVKPYTATSSFLTAGLEKAIKDNAGYLSPEILDQMYKDIDLLIDKSEQANDPVFQSNLHWNGYSSNQLSTRGKEYKYIPTFSAAFQENVSAQADARGLAKERTKTELNQKFRGIYKPLIHIGWLDNELEASELLGSSILKNYNNKRKEELFTYFGQGVDPAAPEPHEITLMEMRGTFFAETPFQIVEKLGEGRGKLNDRNTLRIEMTEKALYEKYTFLEQINALDAQAPWIPYAHDLNIILKKTGTQPIDFLVKQYKVHTGDEMPEKLKERIIKRLSTQKIEGHGKIENPLFRKGLLNKVNNDKDQAMILDREDELLIAGNLQAGMLPQINIKTVPSGLKPLAESKFDRTWEPNTPLKQRQTELGTALYSAGFKDEEELTTMIAIAMSETGTRSIRNHPDLNDTDESYGPLQINMLDTGMTKDLGKWREAKWPWLKNRGDLFDINLNAKAAYDIYKNEPWLNKDLEGLFNAWASYKDKLHLEHMDAARKIAKEIIELQPQESSTIDPSSGLA